MKLRSSNSVLLITIITIVGILLLLLAQTTKCSDRVDCSDWSDSDWTRFKNVVTELIDSGDYREFSSVHSDPDHLIHRQQGYVGMIRFLPWHRALLYHFEQAMQEIDSRATLCYWDFGRARGVPSALSNFYGMSRSRRRPGSSNALPTIQEIRRVMSQDNYDDFSNQLSRLHDRVHVWAGGDMVAIPTSPRDPLFWPLHTFVDYLWSLWQERNDDNIPDRSDVGRNNWMLHPFDEDIDDIASISSLDVEYD